MYDYLNLSWHVAVVHYMEVYIGFFIFSSINRKKAIESKYVTCYPGATTIVLITSHMSLCKENA